LSTNKAFSPLRDFYLISGLSFILFILVVASFYRQSHAEWKKYQKEFVTYLEQNVSPGSVAAFDVSIKQIWLPELNRVDRCPSCHLGYDQSSLKGAPEPFRSHPDIAPHEISKMGCTICHGGQGFALKKKDAHGEIKHWMEPLLGKKMAKKYGFKDEASLIQINCNVCHRRDGETSGMEMINLAKKIITQKSKCQTCHVIDGKGGKQGADLTFVGDKPSERFDFSKIEEKLIAAGNPLSMLSWHFEHFMNSSAVVPESKMPKMDYSEEEAWALAMLMMSWKNFKLPVMLIPKKAAEPLPPGPEGSVSAISSPADRGKTLFESNSCSDCHTIGKGAEIGPDLLGVSEKREANWLKKMIRTPEEMEKTDPIAKKLFLEYKELGMPTARLSEEDAEMIIKYIESFK
jgi:mono/diheme cytochrome c family protein